MPRKILNSHKKISATVSAFILSLSFFSFVTTPSADAWTTARTPVSIFGGTTSDVSYSIAVDSSGNIYTTGSFSGTADFNPGSGTANLTSIGGDDAFVSKIDASGNFLWAKSFGGSSTDSGDSIAVDSTGNVYTTGYFQVTADFDPGAGTSNLISSGGFEAFVSKLDSSGNFLWAKKLGGAANEFASSIAVDSTGNVYSTGMFEGTSDFDPGAGTANLSSVGGSWDAYISKLDSSGNYVWAKSFGGSPNPDSGREIAIDSNGDIYTIGSFFGTVDFDPGVGTANLTSGGNENTFILKLNSSGNYVWAKSFSGTSNVYAQSISIDSSGDIYTVGFFFSTVDFDPGVGTASLSAPAGKLDSFVAKLTSSGDYVWAKNFGGSDGVYGLSIAVDATGNVYTTGYFEGTADFDPGAGTTNLTSGGNLDYFVSKLDPSGNFLWAKSLGGSSTDVGYSIAVDSTGNVYTTGYFVETVDFDPGAGSTNLTSTGAQDVFVLKLSPSGDAEASSAPDAPSLSSFSAGDRRVTIAFAAGADNGAAITDYEYSLNGGSYTSAATTTSPFTIAGLSGRTIYSLTLKARNSVGLSSASGSLSATTTDSTLDASEAAAEAARIAAAKQQKELLEILGLVPELGKISLNIGETTKALTGNKCVKGKTIKYVYKGTKCPKGYVKKK
jgi:hypothetical protein